MNRDFTVVNTAPRKIMSFPDVTIKTVVFYNKLALPNHANVYKLSVLGLSCS